MTEWRSIQGFEGRYEVSDDGRIKVLGGPGRGRLNRDRILKLGRNKNGYFQALLYPGDGSYVARRLHHLVLEAFVGPRPLGMHGLHDDDDPSNNVVSNLRWGTRSENSVDMIRNGNHNHARKTHCKWGHPFSGDNLHATTKQRVCRACADRRRKAHKQRALAVYAAEVES